MFIKVLSLFCLFVKRASFFVPLPADFNGFNSAVADLQLDEVSQRRERKIRDPVNPVSG